MDGDRAAATWEIDDVVRVVCNSHEFCKGGVAEDGIVGPADLHDVKVDLLGAVVVCHPREELGWH